MTDAEGKSEPVQPPTIPADWNPNRPSRKYFKRLAHQLLPGLTKQYLKKERSFRYKGIAVRVMPGVFHPGLFLSTKILMDFLETLDLEGKQMLEIGAGTGILSLYAAAKGAAVTATDISQQAIANIQANQKATGFPLNIVESNLFENLSPNAYDLILINPPYYPGMPEKEEDFAFFCGPDFEYFDVLFDGIGPFLKPDTDWFMILSEDCALDKIQYLAGLRDFRFELEKRTKRWGEWNYLFRIQSEKVLGPA